MPSISGIVGSLARNSYFEGMIMVIMVSSLRPCYKSILVSKKASTDVSPKLSRTHFFWKICATIRRGESVPRGMYGHKGLLEHEQTVTTTMWVAVLPRWMRSPLSAWAFRAQKRREPEDWATVRVGEWGQQGTQLPLSLGRRVLRRWSLVPGVCSDQSWLLA